jgi:orotidine-5'-phosphate decarboxylase
MTEGFGDRLQQHLRERGPLCVGIDPSRSLIESWGRHDTVEGLEFFCLAVLEAIIDTVAVIKPQVAFFERFGSQGYRVLERVMSEARDADLLIIADAKRGDVDTTNDGYAEAWLSEGSPLRADAMTVSPYLGFESLAPILHLARATGRGVFVLAATSNVEGRVIQSARTQDGRSVESFVLEEIRRCNQPDEGLGPFGAVLGATRDRPQFSEGPLPRSRCRFPRWYARERGASLRALSRGQRARERLTGHTAGGSGAFEPARRGPALAR